tara:strand:+ start:724 stop:1395 length:672 start_codon:yes stop_codon:yes gene_type:complete
MDFFLVILQLEMSFFGNQWDEAESKALSRTVKLDEYVMELPGEISADICDEFIDIYDTFVSPEHDLESIDHITNNEKVFIPIMNLGPFLSDNAKGSIQFEFLIRVLEKYHSMTTNKGLDKKNKINEAYDRLRSTGSLPEKEFKAVMSCIAPRDNFGYQCSKSSLTGIIFLNEEHDSEGVFEFAFGLRIEARKGKVIVFPSSWIFAFNDAPFKHTNKYVLYFIM